MNINYEFKNKKLKDIALTHISFANEKGLESNQRLEFLGDSILSFVVAEYIYKKIKNIDEGLLTQMRANAVCEESLARVAGEMNIGESIHFGKSESLNGAKKPSILCDTYEAILGAIYLDSDIETAKKWILENLSDVIEESMHMDFHNYKSEIQTYFQRRDKSELAPTYELVKREGPDHKPRFFVNAVYNGKIIGKGVGTNLKKAEQAAAKQALEQIK